MCGQERDGTVITVDDIIYLEKTQQKQYKPLKHIRDFLGRLLDKLTKKKNPMILKVFRDYQRIHKTFLRKILN